MSKIKITLPDGTVKDFEKGVTAEKIALSIGKRLAQDALAAKVNDNLVDISAKINNDAKIKIITYKNKEGIDIFRHSTAHLMAHAVTDLFPKTKLTIGPVVEEGFYYDFDTQHHFTPEDIVKIEKRMNEIVKKDIKIERIEFSEKEAKKTFKNNQYKLELIGELNEQSTAYKQGSFIDLCKGPHVSSTGKLKAFKLMKIAGAYWKGDSKNKQLQRIYGISFPENKQLKSYLKLLEETEKRDHRKLGKQLDLFSIHEEGPGLIFWHNNGVILKNELMKYWNEEHKKMNYQLIETPDILNRSLWEQSGHWDLFKENMYTTKIDGRDFAIKPMNCPGGMLVYKTKAHSYRELPLRVAELGYVHRHELSGVLAGLFRARAFTQDDAHVFCSEEQLESEIISIIKLMKKMLAAIGFNDYEFTLAVRSEEKKDKYLGGDKGWLTAEKALKNAFNKTNDKFVIEEGEAKFYGPSLDLKIKDAIGRKWQCSTIQLDFNLAERFNITYEGKDGREHKPFILHRVIYGSLERFIGIMIEHYAGKFPIWLAPVQVKILTIADRFNSYAEKIKEEFKKNNLRIELDTRSESVNYKVREAQLQKIPLIIIVGEKEEKNKTVAVRTLDGNVKFGVKVNDLLKRISDNIEKKEQSFKL